MPFKCVKCNKIVQANEPKDCTCLDNHFIECSTIHFLHPEGEGAVFSNTQKVSNIPGKIETKVTTQIRVACTTRKGIEPCTVLASLISCPVCMVFLESRRTPKESLPPKDEPLILDKLDLSAEDMEALGFSPNT